MELERKPRIKHVTQALRDFVAGMDQGVSHP